MIILDIILRKSVHPIRQYKFVKYDNVIKNNILQVNSFYVLGNI